MPFNFLSSRLLAFGIYVFPLASSFGQEPLVVKFRVLAHMIVVPVTINGAGPFNFLIDTGSTDTIIDGKLAEELHLPYAGKMTLETAQGEAVALRVHTESLAMAGAPVRGMDLCIINHYANRLPGVRGLLGEDFLRYFDLLLDNQRHLIQFEFGPGQLADRLTGEHLDLSLNGFYVGEITRNRLVVIGHIHELGDKKLRLLLDSGIPSPLLFLRLNPSTGESSPHSVEGVFGRTLASEQISQFLRLGDKEFRNLTVFVPRGRIPPMDVDGFLPTSLFRSIFISHSGKFAILDPSTRPAPIQSKFISTQTAETSNPQSLRADP